MQTSCETLKIYIYIKLRVTDACQRVQVYIVLVAERLLESAVAAAQTHLAAPAEP